MARVFITGSSDGLGLIAGRQLVDAGHIVALHARSRERAGVAAAALPEASAILVGDVSSVEETRRLADQVCELEPFDAVIHNVGVGSRERHRLETLDGLEHVFAVNVLAPYLLTSLISGPCRLVYLASGLHRNGAPDFDDLQWSSRPWDGHQAYSDSKFLDVALALAVARLWSSVRSNVVEPGWVPTKMGGRGAPDDLELGAATQVWLACTAEAGAAVSGRYFFHQRPQEPHPGTRSVNLQEQLLEVCAQLTGVELPASPPSR